MGGRFWHPAGVRFVFDGVPGVSLALNPRLMSGSPPGCRDTRTAPKDLATAESWRAGERRHFCSKTPLSGSLPARPSRGEREKLRSPHVQVGLEESSA